MTTDARLEDFESGHAIEVPFARIEAELSSLWRQAARGAEQTKARRPLVTRACLWNLVVRVAEEAALAAVKQLVDDISVRVPARVIVVRPVLRQQPDQVRAWIEVNWHEGEGGKQSIGSDEVTLQATGQAAERLPSLVRSLLVSDAPSAMLWPGAPPSPSAPSRRLLGEMDRLIVDLRKTSDERALVELDAMAREQPDLEVTDLAWLGIRPLRGLCASLFDPPGDPAALDLLDRVRVVSGVQGTQARGLLALGWLSSRLGWRGFERVKAEGKNSRRWRATSRAGREITVELETRADCAAHGVAELELKAGARTWSLKRDQRSIDVRGPGVPSRVQPVRSHTDAELVIAALGLRGRDPLFREALAHATQLLAHER